MKSRNEIINRLKELHGTGLAKEMGGQMPAAEAEALLWVLGFEDASVGRMSELVDVSDYIEIED